MTTPEPNAGVFTWVVRGVLALAALAAPVIVYKGFTESDTADPVKQQRLREASRRPATVEPSPERGRDFLSGMTFFDNFTFRK